MRGECGDRFVSSIRALGQLADNSGLDPVIGRLEVNAMTALGIFLK